MRLRFDCSRAIFITGTLAGLCGCSAIPEDLRATLPEAMRGDTQALTEYPTPKLSGSWSDTDFPELAIKMKQSGSNFTFTRNGSYREIPVKATYKGQLEGRSVKVTYLASYPGDIRPEKGQCFGVASKDSSALKLTCEDKTKGTFPMNLKKL